MDKVFLALVRLGIGNSCTADLPERINWKDVQTLANTQGLSAVVLDGVEVLRNRRINVVLPDKLELTQWIGGVLQGYEYTFELYCRSIAELAEIYNSHGYKMMVLKGYACSIDWPKPEHRPCGDIDIWLFGKQKDADLVLAQERGVDIDNSHHHHTVFCWRDFTVENHYDFINMHHHKSHKSLERILKQLANDDSHFVNVYGEKVYLPSPNLHALFLLKHLMLHFASGEITIRQIIDWAFFMEKHSVDVDWDWLCSVMDEFQMRDFFSIINAICVEDLGFSANIFHGVQFTPFLKDRVLKDILNPVLGAEIPKNIFTRKLWKSRRWKANEWKHKLCYKESMWSAFWSGVWNHILKPSLI